MPTHRLLLTLVGVVSSLVLSACAGGTGDGSVIAPTALQAPAVTAPLNVQVDQLCTGQESQIRVFVDREPIGVTNPGLRRLAHGHGRRAPAQRHLAARHAMGAVPDNGQPRRSS